LLYSKNFLFYSLTPFRLFDSLVKGFRLTNNGNISKKNLMRRNKSRIRQVTWYKIKSTWRNCIGYRLWWLIYSRKLTHIIINTRGNTTNSLGSWCVRELFREQQHLVLLEGCENEKEIDFYKKKMTSHDVKILCDSMSQTLHPFSS
jgi:hypothetical protein